MINKNNRVLKIMTTIVAVSLCLLLKSNVQAITAEDAGKYVAEWAINFFDSHASETVYSYTQSHREAAYQGNKTSGTTGSKHPVDFTDKYAIDCVGWISMAVHQSIGLGNSNWGEFGIPYPNDAPGFFNGYECILGSGGSRNKIELNDLKQKLKPGDILLKTDKHVLLYVGDNTLIHCTGHGPGEEYGGDNGYGLIKESLDHFYNSGYGIEAVGRLSDSAASSINESNCTTVFGETGKGLTGIWEKASTGGSGTSSSSSNSGSDLSSKFTVEGMNQDLSLGLIYPKDNSNTPLDSFIDFTSPFLQTWMIPLAMNSGVSNKKGEEELVKNPYFSYLTIKEAMSDITVDRYDITKCTLKTKYKVYDTITYKVSKDSEGNTVKTEVSRTSTDESSEGPTAEKLVSKNFDVNTKYCIKDAKTFDVKMTCNYNYEKYKDEDVEKRINAKKENKEEGESFSEGSDPGGDSYPYTYTVKEGHYVDVTRIWEDEFVPGDCNVETYKVSDVEEYIEKGGMKKPVSKATTAGYSQTGEIYNCKGYTDMTAEQLEELAVVVYGEYGEDIEGMKTVASSMANLFEWKNYTGSNWSTVYEFVTKGKWFASGSWTRGTNDDARAAVQQCIVEGKRTIPPYINEFDSWNLDIEVPAYTRDYESQGYVQGETVVRQKASRFVTPTEGKFWCINMGASGDANIFYYTNDKYKEYCESQYTVTGSGSSSTTTSSVKDLKDFLFIGDSLTYGLKESNAISEAQFIGVIGSSATHWNQWLSGTKTKWDSNIDFSSKKMPEESKIKGVCIMLGFNALDGGNSADSAMTEMKTFIDKICAKYPNVPIYVEKVLPCREGKEVTNASATNEQIKKYNEALSSYCSSKGVLFIDTTEGYVGSDGQLSSDKTKDGVHLKEYNTLADNIRKAITSSTVTNNAESAKINTEGLENFNITDRNYYRIYENEKEINRVDMMNSRPENYLQYLDKGEQYSNHVGYTRAYLTFSYDELRRMFKEKFEKNIPYIYGQSLGFKSTYDEEKRIMDAGTVSGQITGGKISSESSLGSLEKDPSKKNILLIAGHWTSDRELPGSMSFTNYTEPAQNRELVMELAGAIEAAGMNAVIANRVISYQFGENDNEDSYGNIWGNYDFRGWRMGTRGAKGGVESIPSYKGGKDLFNGYDYVLEVHHNASDNSHSASGSLIMTNSGRSVTELDKELGQIVANYQKDKNNRGVVPYSSGNLGDIVFFDNLNTPITYFEIEFYDNNSAMEYIVPNYSNIAGDIAMKLREHFGVTTPIKTSNSSGSASDSSTDGAGVSIMGKSQTDRQKMVTYLKNNNPVLPMTYINELVDAYISEGEAEGVRGDIAFAQACVETDRFKFDMGTAVTIDQNNFAGIGVTQKGLRGNSFPSVQIGVRAQIQHLKAYCSTESLKNSCVDPRFDLVTRGCASDVKSLGGKWAADTSYGKTIMSVLQQIQAM